MTIETGHPFTSGQLADLRSEPRDPSDLMIAARNGWVLCLDNLQTPKSR